MSEAGTREIAARALSVLDLTNLRDDCDAAEIDLLCARAQTAYGNAAAICIWPRFVAHARVLLGKANPVRIATVVNFPSGNLPVDDVVAETRTAIADGADEIDLVIPYSAFAGGDEAAVTEMVSAVRAACGDLARLKVILETGELGDAALIRKASGLAIDAGADFIKTSTGKVAINATPEASRIMLEVIREHGGQTGFKPAGGIGNVATAGEYLALVDEILGPGHTVPATFRFGASGLLDDILAVLEGRVSAKASSGY